MLTSVDSQMNFEAAELWEHGITVNAYAPGLVKTDFCEVFSDYNQLAAQRSFFFVAIQGHLLTRTESSMVRDLANSLYLLLTIQPRSSYLD